MLFSETYQQFFHSPAFQSKWQAYLNAFGDDLDELFGDDFKTKILFAEGLQLLLENKLSEAYHAHIRHFADQCETEADRRVYNRLVKLCYNEEDMSAVGAGDWVKYAFCANGFRYCRVESRTVGAAAVKTVFSDGLTYCRTDSRHPYFDLEITDLKTYQRLTAEEMAYVGAFLSEHPEEEELTNRHTDRMLRYRDTLLNSGMREAAWNPFHFYRYTSENTAFTINLKDLGTHIQAVYGFTTVIDGEHFSHWSERDDDIKLRHIALIRGDSDEPEVARAVQTVFEPYKDTAKDDILALKKERQKAFLSKIHARLKPLGFTKKASKWTKKLGADLALVFEAQKSAYSDVFYFNVFVSPAAVSHPVCFVARVNAGGVYPHGQGTVNWQLLSEEDFSTLMDNAIRNVISPILRYAESPVEHEREIRDGCTCDRRKCEICRLEEALWREQNAEG